MYLLSVGMGKKPSDSQGGNMWHPRASEDLPVLSEYLDYWVFEKPGAFDPSWQAFLKRREGHEEPFQQFNIANHISVKQQVASTQAETSRP